MKYIIGKPINGVTINGNEYACDDNGFVIEFNSIEEAENYLHNNGVSDKEIEELGIVFEKVEEG